MGNCILILAAGLVAAGHTSPAGALETVAVADNVYAIVGELSNRSKENLGNNATFGLVVTSEGVVLIDPGGSFAGARQLHAAVKTVTDAPIRLVINTGGQDHRWLGNAYFRQLGAEIIASRAAVADQRARARDQYIVLAGLLGEDTLRGTEFVHADRTFDEALEITLGDTTLELVATGGAHTPGDISVWVSGRDTVFTGDLVFTERLLGVLDVSDTGKWIAAFEAMASRRPEHVVPGHGHPATLARASADTLEYLVYLRNAVREFIDAGGEISDVGAIDQRRFRHLVNFDLLAGRNAQAVYQQLEWE